MWYLLWQNHKKKSVSKVWHNYNLQNLIISNIGGLPALLNNNYLHNRYFYRACIKRNLCILPTLLKLNTRLKIMRDFNVTNL